MSDRLVASLICHLDRSGAEWRDLRFSLLSSHVLVRELFIGKGLHKQSGLLP
jgi:hypothetical protein